MEFIIDILQLIGFLIVAPITALILIDALTTIVITNSHSDFKSILDDVEFMVEYGEYTMLFPIKGSDTKIQFISKIPNIFNDNIDKDANNSTDPHFRSCKRFLIIPHNKMLPMIHWN